MSPETKLTPEQLEGVHFSSERELEDDDELYEFDELCITKPEEVVQCG